MSVGDARDGLPLFITAGRKETSEGKDESELDNQVQGKAARHGFDVAAGS
jgi:hypothetical protein